MATKTAPRLSKAIPVAAAALIAGVVVVAVSLPLQSPHDSLMNSGTIAVAVVLTAVAFSATAVRVSEGRDLNWTVAVMSLAGFVLAAIAAVAVETVQDLERTISFVVPLAAIQFGITAALTPVIRTRRSAARWILVGSLIVLLTTGFALADQGDQESGRLELPPRTQ